MHFDPMTATLLQAVVTSVLLPFIISLLKNPKWSKEVKTYFAFGFSILVTGAILFVENKLNPEDIILSVLMVVLGAQGFYEKWFQNSNVNKYLTNIFTLDKNDLVETVQDVLDSENESLGTPKIDVTQSKNTNYTEVDNSTYSTSDTLVPDSTNVTTDTIVNDSTISSTDSVKTEKLEDS